MNNNGAVPVLENAYSTIFFYSLSGIVTAGIRNSSLCIGAVVICRQSAFHYGNLCTVAQICIHSLILCKLQRDDFFTVCTRSSVIGLRSDSIYAFSFYHLNFRTACTSCKQLAGCIAVTRDGNRHGEQITAGCGVVACGLHFLGDEHTALALLRIGGDHVGKDVVGNGPLVSIIAIRIEIIGDHNIKVTGGDFFNGIRCILRHTNDINCLILRQSNRKRPAAGSPAVRTRKHTSVAIPDRRCEVCRAVKHNAKLVAACGLCECAGNALRQREALSGVEGQLAVVTQPDNQIAYVLIVCVVLGGIGICCCTCKVCAQPIHIYLLLGHVLQAVDTPGVQTKASNDILVIKILCISIILGNIRADCVADLRRGNKIPVCVLTVDVDLVYIVKIAHSHLTPGRISQISSSFACTAGGRPVEADKGINLFRIRYTAQYICQSQQLQIILIGVLVGLVVCIGSVTLIPEDTVFSLFPSNIRHAIFLFCGLINREIGLVIVVTVFQRGSCRYVSIAVGQCARSIGCKLAILVCIEADISVAVLMFRIRQVGTGNTGDHNSTVRSKDITADAYAVVQTNRFCILFGVSNDSVLVGNCRLQQRQSGFLDADPQLLITDCILDTVLRGIGLDQFDFHGIPKAVGLAVNRIGDRIAFTAHKILDGIGNQFDIGGNIRCHRGGSTLANSILIAVEGNCQEVLQFHVLANGVNEGKGCLCDTAGTGGNSIGDGVEDVSATLDFFSNFFKGICQITGRTPNIKVFVRVVDIVDHSILGCTSRNLVKRPISGGICSCAILPFLIMFIGSFHRSGTAGIKFRTRIHDGMGQTTLFQINTDSIHHGIHAVSCLHPGLLVGCIQNRTKNNSVIATGSSLSGSGIFPTGSVCPVCFTVSQNNDNGGTAGLACSIDQHIHTGINTGLDIGAVAAIFSKCPLI